MHKKNFKKLTFLLIVMLMCCASLFACSEPVPPSPSEKIEHIAPYENVGEFLDETLSIPSFNEPFELNDENEQVYDALFYQSEVLLNDDAAKGATLEQVIADNKLICHPSMSGQISDSVPRVKKQIMLNTDSKNTIVTGLYAAAGETITLELSEAVAASVKITIASSMKDVAYGEPLIRFPKLKRSFNTTGAKTYFGTPFGGLITLDIISSITEPIYATISGAVETPHFILGKTTIDEWELFKTFEGLEAHLIADSTQIVCPSHFIKDIDDPSAVLSFWSDIVSYQNEVVNKEQTDIFFDGYYFPLALAEASLDIARAIKGEVFEVINTLAMQRTSSNELSFMLALVTALDKTILGNLDNTATQDVLDYSYALTEAKGITTEHDYFELQPLIRRCMHEILAHRFGYEGVKLMFSVSESSVSYSDEIRDRILIELSRELGYDMRMFFDYFKFDNSFAAKDTVAKMSLPVFYPVATDFTSRSYFVTASEPYKLYVGTSMVSLFGDVSLLSIKGDKGTFVETDKGVYVFTPLKENRKLSGRLTVTLVTPSETVQLSSYFYSADDDKIQSVFNRTNHSFVFVVPVTKYIALSASAAAGVIIGITLPLAVNKRKKKKQPLKD